NSAHVQLQIKMRLISVILCVFLSFCTIDGFKILCIAPAMSHSHYTLASTLAKDLAKRGHEVTILAPYKEKEPVENLRSLLLTGFVEEWDKVKETMNMFNTGNLPTILTLMQLGGMGGMLVDKTLGHEVVQDLLNSNETFDAVILEHFISDGLRAIAYHFGAVPISFASTSPGTWTNHLVGNIDLPSYTTQVYIESPIHTDFCKRIHNMLLYILQKLYDHLFFYPKQNAIIHKYFPDFPHIYDLMYNTSLILFSSDASFSEPVPKLPNMIEIGGFHVLPTKKLPEDLQKILDNAKNGVVYFSMGSVLNSKDMPSEKRDAILKSLSKLKETVLWKYEEELPGTPSNVIIR
ncbi:glucuronosyltransferase, partial [Oryctes borbonicus]